MAELRSRLRNTPRDVDDAKALVDEIMPQGYSPKWLKGRDKKTLDVLGFRHWLLILLIIACVYAFIYYEDSRMPDVISSGQYENFSEDRARQLLVAITALGPRPSGSEACEVKATSIIMNRLENVRSEVEARGVNRFEVDVQRPSGCFDLMFLSSFTLCYSKITNIIARIGPKTPAKHAILLNSHFDTLADSPGATDDAVSCAIMMEILDILAHLTTPLENDIIFLFNGAEENFLQASHGFITQHPWRHTVRAFINLEGAGAGGREILFQAGPGNSWLLQTYLENAPHPHCSVLAQEIFQAGLVPSDTDFRVFRDYGLISGLDIAYFRNGWVYHTEFDQPKYIAKGCIQRAGDNILAVVKALIKSPYLEHPGAYEGNKGWVFYDVIGLFTVFYSASLGSVLNYAAAVAVFALVAYRIKRGIYSFGDLGHAFLDHLIAASCMFAVGSAIVAVVIKMGMVMCWYGFPELVFPLYIFPMLVAGCAVHNVIAHRSQKRSAEMVHFDSVLIIYAVLLVLAQFAGIASAFFVLIHVSFPLLRDPLLYLLGKLRIISKVTARWLLAVQLACTVPVVVFGGYAVMLLFEFFIPVTGRLGKAVNPEYFVMPIAFLTALSFVLYTNNLMYVSRRMDYLLKCGFTLFVIFFVTLATTRLGWPYRFSLETPRLRRIIAADTKRTVYSFGNTEIKEDHGLFVQSFDFRGISDLPDHTFLSGNGPPNCNDTADEYCRLPYYTAIVELLPPEESRWIPLPYGPKIAFPMSLALTEKESISENEIRMSFVLKGGFDKLSLHLTPLDGYVIKKWSFTNIVFKSFGKRRTYFVFMSYGSEPPEERRFWLLLENKNLTAENVQKSPALEIAVASQYTHGPNQNSEALLQLRQLIASRRTQPHVSIGWWKWGITMIGGVAEIIVHTF